ncbi:MAG: glycogen debranching N-terminal domain-containing protein [Deinococcales bacterium]
MRLKENTMYLVADTLGQISGGETGLYDRDTRFVSHLEWRIGGEQPTVLSTHTPEPFRFSQHATEHGLGSTQRLEFRRKGWLSGASYEETVRLVPFDLLESHEYWGRTLPDISRLEFIFNCDFSDMFEVRGLPRIARDVVVTELADGLLYQYDGQDGCKRAVQLEISPMGQIQQVQLEEKNNHPITFDTNSHAEISPDAPAPMRVARVIVWHIPPEGMNLTIRITPKQDGLTRPQKSRAALELEYAAWRRQNTVRLSNPLIQRVFDRSSEDLRALVFDTEHGMLPAAGIPWFVTPFGRDPIVVSLFCLPWYPSIAKGTLQYLAAKQGREYNPKNLEAPGKILHEERDGEAARTGRIPFQRYFGTVDATPLWVCLLEDYRQTTQDLEMVRLLEPNLRAALAWMQSEDADPDQDGFIEYTPHKGGITNQVWKDSGDSTFDEFGQDLKHNVAVVEVQAYAYRAYQSASKIYAALGDLAQANKFASLATTLQTEFNSAFWLPELCTYAHALDANKKPARVLVSNAGHTLWAGIVPPEYAPLIAKTLFSSALWSGWGIRTLGQGMPRYNPVSYHNGSVWSHDNALTALGLARYGFNAEVKRLVSAQLDAAALSNDARLSELFAGFSREEISGLPLSPPVSYPAACHPQAWDAAAPYAFLKAALECEAVPAAWGTLEVSMLQAGLLKKTVY